MNRRPGVNVEKSTEGFVRRVSVYTYYYVCVFINNYWYPNPSTISTDRSMGNVFLSLRQRRGTKEDDDRLTNET